MTRSHRRETSSPATSLQAPEPHAKLSTTAASPAAGSTTPTSQTRFLRGSSSRGPFKNRTVMCHLNISTEAWTLEGLFVFLHLFTSQVSLLRVPEDTFIVWTHLLCVGCPGGRLHGSLPGPREAGLHLQRGGPKGQNKEPREIQRWRLARCKCSPAVRPSTLDQILLQP